MEEKVKRFKELKAILTLLYQNQEALASKEAEAKESYNEACEKVNEFRDIIESEKFDDKKKDLEAKLQILQEEIVYFQNQTNSTLRRGNINKRLILLFTFFATASSFVFVQIPLSLLMASLVLGSSLAIFRAYENKLIRSITELSKQIKRSKKQYDNDYQELHALSRKRCLSDATIEIEKARLDRKNKWNDYMEIHKKQNEIDHEILFTEAEYSRLGLEIAEICFKDEFDFNLPEEETKIILEELVKILLKEKKKIEAKRYFFANEINNN